MIYQIDQFGSTSPAPAADPLAAVSVNLTEQDYQTLVGLLAAYTTAERALAAHQAHADSVLLAVAESCRTEFCDLQQRMEALETEMERLARLHPEWFAKRKSLVTPCGTVKMTATTKLVPLNEETCIALLRRHLPQIAEQFIRKEESLNLEAMAGFTDRVLRRLKVRRIQGDSFSVATPKAALGKAVAKTGEGRK